MQKKLAPLLLHAFLCLVLLFTTALDKARNGVEDPARPGEHACLAHDFSLESYYRLLRLFVLEGDWVWENALANRPGVPADAGCGTSLRVAAVLAPFATLLTLLYALSTSFRRAVTNGWKSLAAPAGSRHHRTLVIGSSRAALALLRNIGNLDRNAADYEAYPKLMTLGPVNVDLATPHRHYPCSTLAAGLRQARASKMTRIVSFLEDDDQQLALALALHEMCTRKGKRETGKEHKLELLLRVSDRGRMAKIFDLGRVSELELDMRLNFFDESTLAARFLYSQYPLDIYADLQMQRHIHLLVHGGNLLALALVREAAYYYITRPAPFALHVTLVGPEAHRIRDLLLDEAPALASTVHIDSCELALDYLNDATRIGDCIRADASAHVVALEEEAAAVAYAARLRRMMLQHSDGSNEVAPVFVRVLDASGFGELMTDTRLADRGIFGFGTLADIMTLENLHSDRTETLARAIHQRYTGGEHQGGDAHNARELAHTRYGALGTWMQESNRRAARHLAIKARATGCRIVQDDRTGTCFTEERFAEWIARPSQGSLLHDLCDMEHRRWWAERALRGVRLAPLRCDALRTHNDFLPFTQLVDQARHIDNEQVRSMCWLLQQAGEGLRPVLVVGVIGQGPARFDKATTALVREKLAVIFTAIRTSRVGATGQAGTGLAWAPVLLSNGAPGVDQWALDVAKQHEIDERWIALPLPAEIYAQQIDEDERKAQTQADVPARAAFFDAVKLGTIVVSVPTARSLVNLRMDPSARAQQYRKAGLLVLERSDLLIAVHSGDFDELSLTRELIQRRTHAQQGGQASAFFPKAGRGMIELNTAALPGDSELTAMVHAQLAGIFAS